MTLARQVSISTECVVTKVTPPRSSDDTIFLHIPLAATVVTPLVGVFPPFRVGLLMPEHHRALVIRAHVVGEIVRVTDSQHPTQKVLCPAHMCLQ